MSKLKEEMVNEFQCPGCTNGYDTECGQYNLVNYPDWGFKCSNHSAGTFLLGVGRIALGFPKGFNRIQESKDLMLAENIPDNLGEFDKPFWKAKHNGKVFLRIVQARIGKVLSFAVASDKGYDELNCLDVTKLEMD